MPNWCVNFVEVSHPDPAKLQELLDAYADKALLDYAVPMPEALNIEKSFDPSADLLAIRADNLVKYGAGDWYDWRHEFWGTKWDICYPEDAETNPAGTVSLRFDTAWSPPIPAYRALQEKGFKIDAEFTEEGRFFVGYWRDGDELVVKPEEAPADLEHLVSYWASDEEVA